jgi:Tfp pilus assembly protein PilF
MGLELARANRIADAIPIPAAAACAADFAEAHANLGAAYLTTGQLPQAIDELTTAVRINPNYDLARANLARARAAAGRRDR